MFLPASKILDQAVFKLATLIFDWAYSIKEVDEIYLYGATHTLEIRNVRVKLQEDQAISLENV